MKQIVVLAVVLSAGLAVAGCNKTQPTRNEAPLKTGQGVDRKGNPTKQMEATFEDTGAPKR